ncbi:hypothetical protein B0A50_04681 [Salinomyces thailandicus]|uniref:Xylose isomerase-like TIM barrel domain-containing protein n=1 Tax=Salinomyces thailandicus TaxID=706561 RepID=A0A4U0TV92_9PEZI|nr:hypothetical protein B0A50_04681 [Salinomyces thailandica]
MPEKLDQAAHYGLDIELFYEDLEYVAKSLPGGLVPHNLLAAANIVRALCEQRKITVVCLQPFMHYEGLRDRQKHAQRIEEMRLWIVLAKILGTNLISIPSTTMPEDQMTGDLDVIVDDLREIADLGASHGIQYSYESLAWGTYSDTWEQSWKVVQSVDRANFGLCLDTFNMAARTYADPSAPTRRNPNAEADMKASLERLVKTVDVRKIAFVQVVDAEYLAEPLQPGHPYYDASQPARMSWSRNCRLFYGEEERGAYLPVKAILKAILIDLGYEGYVSAELFNSSLTDANPDVPASHAQRAVVSWQKIVRDFQLSDGVSSEPALVGAAAVQEQVRAQL